MEANKFTKMLDKKSNKITRVLIYVVLEWTLIFLLLLNSLFSYLILKFAVYFGLKPPCFLCSRLDHVLDSHFSKKKSIPSYKEFFCDDHSLELSNFEYCLHHKKLITESKSNVCEVCSEHKHDATLTKWMNEFENENEDENVVKKCSCCDDVIKPRKRNIGCSKYIGFMANVITERELNGCFLEHDEGDSEYQMVDDDDDEDGEEDDNDGGALEDEKQPLLSVNDDEEVNMLVQQQEQQHLEFYVDHDDYRLIPVGIVGKIVKNESDCEESSKKDEKNAILERFCRDVDLVFEADELMSGCCKVSGKSLPSIQEDDEEEEELVAGELAEKQGKVHSQGLELVAAELAEEIEKQVEEHSQVLEFDEEKRDIEELVAAELAEAVEKQVEEPSQVSEFVEERREIEELVANEEDEKQVEEHSQVLEFAKDVDEEKRELDELFAAELAEESEKQVEEHSKALEFTEEKTAIEDLVAAKVAEKQVEEHSQVSEFVEEKREIEVLAEEPEKQVEVHSQVLEISQEFVEEKRDREDLVADELAEKQVEVHSQVVEFTQELIAAKVTKEAEKQVEELSQVLEFTEEKSEIVELVVDELADKQVEVHSQVLEFSQGTDEESTEFENLSVLHKQDKSTVSESASVLQEIIEDSREVDAENRVHSTSAVNVDEIETGIEKNENVTQEVSIEVDEHPIACGNDNPSITDNGVCEAATCSMKLLSTDETDADVNKRSLNVNVARMSINETEDDKFPDTPNSISSPNVHKKFMLLGRSRSITEESLDGSIMSEHEGVDGATLVSKLKLDLQTEKKTLRALYAELEEERNASAIAANQTMAMINRLQEEKATMQMEALQYQRMMEEQSEYDQEALQMMNELMVKREKEKLELEKEVEVYRKKLLDFEEREKIRILSRRMEGSTSVRSRNSSASCSYGEESDGLSIDLNHEVKEHEEETSVLSPSQDNTPSDAFLGLQESLGGFENERMSILEQLKVLEEKLFSLADEEEEDENGKESDHENGWPNGSMQKRLLPLFDEVELLDSNEEIEVKKSHCNKFELEKKRVAIEEEVDHVYERLHALEADREFLKHCIGSLRKGDKGLDLLQEILQHLRDLKNVELHVMKNMDPCSSI